MRTKKRFFASHAKSSAALVSLAIHAILIIVAFSFVAVTVITKADQSFEAKPVSRPKMQMKKLQVPVTVKKKRPKPKLRKRIVVKPRLNQSAPDIQMPEITGVKGGIGSAGDGLGGAAAIGFSMPEIEIFGVKGKGEKIVLALSSDADMMLDEKGGIPAYTIIKNEMIRIVEELPSTALFNVFIYERHGNVTMAFPTLVTASEANAKKMKDWITPLNAVKAGMGDRDYGLHTLGPGGVKNSDAMRIGKFADTKKVGGVKEADLRSWYKSAMIAQKMQADTIFILTDSWNVQRVPTSARQSREEWNLTSAGKKWNEAYKKALKTLDEENRQRRAAGEPPKAINRDEWSMRHDYYPDLQTPPVPDWYYFTPKDFAEGFLLTREQYRPKTAQATSGIKRKRSRKIDFSYNVIQFVKKGGDINDWSKSPENFQQLTSICNGDYKTIAGLAEIQSHVSSSK